MAYHITEKIIHQNLLPCKKILCNNPSYFNILHIFGLQTLQLWNKQLSRNFSKSYANNMVANCAQPANLSITNNIPQPTGSNLTDLIRLIKLMKFYKSYASSLLRQNNDLLFFKTRNI